jgi:HEAT repeats
MEQHKKIDNSLKERRAIMLLLEKLKADGITVGEMEEIGAKLRTSGRRALSPLVRMLRREKKGDLISRYAYLLDFFEDGGWIDQLVQIAISRRDLDEEGKTALLAVLAEYGVDVSTPPLAALLSCEAGSSETTVTRLLDQGDEGLVCFLEDLFWNDPESRPAMIRELSRINDPRVLTLMEILTSVDDRDIQVEAVTTLGRMRMSGAAALLRGLQNHPERMVRTAAVRSFRRLSFLGIAPPPLLTPAPRSPYHRVYASPFDAAGVRTVWFSRRSGEDMISALYLQLHESDGISAAWGCEEMTGEEFARYLVETGCDDSLSEVAPEYALILVRDALVSVSGNGALLPAEYYVWRKFLGTEEITPEAYVPEFGDFDPDYLAVSPRHIDMGHCLFDDDFFAGWMLANGRVCDYAEEWSSLEKTAGRFKQARGEEAILERFCLELLVPGLAQIKRRLLLTADLMRQSGRDRLLIERTLAAALSLDTPRLQNHHHPFLKRFAMESMTMARDALAEGFDPRTFNDDEDGW